MAVKIVVKRVGRPFKLPDVEKIVVQEIADEAERVKDSYEKTAATWSRKPKFQIRKRGKRSTEVFTENEIYEYLDKGTRPHVIRAKRASTLSFNTAGFQSKTVPRRLTPRPGKAAGPPRAFPIAVQHPGMRARGYTPIIRRTSQKRLKRNVDRALQIKLRTAHKI